MALGSGLREALTCETCEAVFSAPGSRGPIPRYCLPCRSRRAVDQMRGYRGWLPPDRRTCKDCGATLGVPKRWYCNGCYLAHERLRKAKRRGVEESSCEVFSLFEIFERDRWICLLCGDPVKRNGRHPDPLAPSLDHIIPISRGGAHVRANVQLAHLRCNLVKGNR